MKRITRETFIKQCAKISAMAMISPYSANLIGRATENISQYVPVPDKDILQRLVIANDEQVSRIFQQEGPGRGRWLAHGAAILASSYIYPDSEFYQNPEIPPKLEQIAKALLALQTPDGTINAGNLESPPDTAFLLEPLCAGATVLMKNDTDVLDKAKEDIRKFIVRAGEGLITGGAHTPNHRWVICSALAWINSLYPDQKYVDRIHEWLADGIFQDRDGHYPERSRNYAVVENNSMMTIGRLLKNPELFEYVRKNLAMTWYYMEPDGDLITNDSRRQDQGGYIPMTAYYMHYRYMALYDNDGHFSAIAKRIELLDGFKEEFLDRAFVNFLAEPVLQNILPENKPLETDFEKLFETSHLLRIRRQDKTMTLYGGVDWPLMIASGRSFTPNFFSYRKGKAILKYARMSANFFRMGYFYSDGLKKLGDKYILHKKLEVPYYQPMTPEQRNPNGDYELTPSMNRRFWSKLDFPDRPVSNVKTLDSTVILSEDKGNADLTFRITGQVGVMVTIELCFEEGGELSGVTASDNQADIHFLEDRMGQYRHGKDTIQFGPGVLTHKNVNRLEGERYSTHNGTLRTEGMRVYMTGMTPFEHKITFRGQHIP